MKKKLLKSLMITFVSVVIGLTSVMGADQRRGANR